MKGLSKTGTTGLVDSTSWVAENDYARNHKEEVKATTRIIMRLISYMEMMNMSQSDLARELGVTPQYIHKLIHGQDYSFRIDTAIEYGKKLGIKLIEVSDDDVCVFHKVYYGTFEKMEMPQSHNFNTYTPWEREKSLSFAW